MTVKRANEPLGGNIFKELVDKAYKENLIVYDNHSKKDILSLRLYKLMWITARDQFNEKLEFIYIPEDEVPYLYDEVISIQFYPYELREYIDSLKMPGYRKGGNFVIGLTDKNRAIFGSY